ncbi:MAG: YfhO family protein [Muricomes sp.]
MAQKIPKDGYLFLTFKVKNLKSGKDVSIFVKGEKNKISSRHSIYYNKNEEFHYTFPVEKDTQEIPVTFGSGKYEISNLQCRIGTVDDKKNSTLYQNPAFFQICKSGDGYEGRIEASGGEWLITSIPYDRNFQIIMDGKENTATESEYRISGIQSEKWNPSGQNYLSFTGQNPGVLSDCICNFLHGMFEMEETIQGV